MVVGLKEISFCGHTITSEEIKADLKKSQSTCNSGNDSTKWWCWCRAILWNGAINGSHFTWTLYEFRTIAQTYPPRTQNLSGPHNVSKVYKKWNKNLPPHQYWATLTKLRDLFYMWLAVKMELVLFTCKMGDPLHMHQELSLHQNASGHKLKRMHWLYYWASTDSTSILTDVV